MRPSRDASRPKPWLATLGLVPGADGYLAGLTLIDSSFFTKGLRVVTLDGAGRATGTSSDLPVDGAGNWVGAFANGSYRVVLGGSPQHFASLTPGADPSVGELALNASQYLRFAAVVPDGSGLLTSFDQTGTSPGGDPQPNLAELGLDGSVQSTALVGTRPSQQALPLLAATNGEFFLAYSALGREGSAVGYSFLGPDGTPLGIDGEIAAGASLSSAFDNWALSAADGRFLVSQNSGLSLFDSTESVTHVVLQQTPDPTRAAVVGTLGVGQILALSEHNGNCGEDCAWNDVGARRYGLDGVALDAGMLFGPDPNVRNFARRSGSLGIWDGHEFVIVAEASSLEWRRVGGDGTLLDADWRQLDPGGSGEYVSAYGIATANGVTFVAWSEGDVVYASHIAPDGSIDPAPSQIAQLGGTPPPDPGSGLVIPGVSEPDGFSVAYDGSRFVVAWAIDGVVHAVAVETDGTVHPTVTLTSPETAPESHRPSLASLGDGKLLVAYHRFDSDPASLTSRVKLRVVGEGPAELGSDCTSDDDCASAFCSSGLCCDARCDQPGSSCASANTDAPDGICSLVTAVDPVDAGTPAVSCDDDGVCPPHFTCDRVKLVCVPPPVVAAAPVTNGCGCRVEQGGNSTGTWFALAVVLGLSLRRRRARRFEHIR